MKHYNTQHNLIMHYITHSIPPSPLHPHKRTLPLSLSLSLSLSRSTTRFSVSLLVSLYQHRFPIGRVGGSKDGGDGQLSNRFAEQKLSAPALTIHAQIHADVHRADICSNSLSRSVKRSVETGKSSDGFGIQKDGENLQPG